MAMRVLFASTLLAFASITPSLAQAAIKHQIDIPARNLGFALATLARQTKIQIVYSSKLVEGQRAGALSGSMTPEEALDRLLAATKLTYEFLDPQTVTLSSVQGSGRAPVDSTSSQGSESPHLTAEESQGWWQREVRLAQADSGRNAEIPRSPLSKDGIVEIEEVIVTAQKREERLIDVPQSVSVLSTDELAKLGAVQFRDFANTIPGLNFNTTGAGFTQISLRGVTTGYDIGPTVAIYVDEVPYGSTGSLASGARFALDVGLFDIERIEVLRGPQGTLYGASSMGGLIKYVNKRPDATTFGVDAQTGVSGTHDGGVNYNGAATVNAPLVTDKVALRVNGFYSHDGGYIDNRALGEKDVNSSDTYGGRADLLLTPTEALSIRVTGFLQDISREGQATADHAFATGEPLVGSLAQGRLFAEPFDQRFRLVSGTVTYDLGRAALTSISSYQTVRMDLAYDLSPLWVPIAASLGRSYDAVGYQELRSTDKFTQEVRLASEGSDVLEWLIGGFYTHEDSTSDEGFLLRESTGQLAPNDLFALSQSSTYEEYAAFGDLTWHLTSQFDVTGGLRYARNQQVSTQDNSGLFGESLLTNRSSENVTTYLGTARYHFSDHATAYLRYATGYRPGGPNGVATDPVTGLPLAPPTFDADRLKSYEIGFKAETADRRFGIDIAGFYIDWSDVQVTAVRNGFGVRVNAPDGATVRGAELVLTANPGHAFTATGSFAYQDAHMSEANTDIGAARGERLPNVPRVTASVSADYAFAEEGLRPTIGTTLRYISDRQASFDDGTFPQYHIPEYTAVDLRAGCTLGPVNAQFYVRNLFDERGQLATFNWNSVHAQPAILQPRTVGLTVTTRF